MGSGGGGAVTPLAPRLAPTQTQQTMLLFQSLELLGHEILHLLYVHASPALWGCPHKVSTRETTSLPQLPPTHEKRQGPATAWHQLLCL